jgi:hypothetical protein
MLGFLSDAFWSSEIRLDCFVDRRIRVPMSVPYSRDREGGRNHH